MPLRAGVIADDFTGATDIAGALVDGGLRTVQFSVSYTHLTLPTIYSV